MAKDDQKGEGAGAEILLELFKEQTLHLAENTKALRALKLQITGIPPSDDDDDEGVDGLMDRIGSLEESVSQLEVRMIGLNLHVSRASFIADHMLTIVTGDPTADPPVEPRAVTIQDVAEGLAEYEKKVQEEEAQAEEEEKAEREAEDKAAKEAEEKEKADAAPKKPPMLSSGAPKGPGLKSLPPLPVMEDKK